MTVTAAGPYAESAWPQLHRAIRLPQSPADAIKLALQEDIVPRRADRVLFWLARAVATDQILALHREQHPLPIVSGLIVVALAATAGPASGTSTGSQPQPARHEHHMPEGASVRNIKDIIIDAYIVVILVVIVAGPLILLHGYRVWWVDTFYAVFAIACIGGSISHYRVVRRNRKS